MVALSNFIPQASDPPQVAPKTVRAQPSSVQPSTNINLLAKALAATEKDGSKDDPLGKLLIDFSKVIDELKKTVASHGPEGGRLAAEAAAKVMRQEAARLSSRIRLGALAGLAVAGFGVLGLGVWGGWTLRGSVAIQVAGAAIPPDMARRFPYQNWADQWAARQTLPPDKSGFQWVMVPFVENLPKPPKR